MQGDPAVPLERLRRRFLAGDGGVGNPRAQLEDLVAQEAPLLGPEHLESTVTRLERDLLGMGTVEELLDDPLVTDVFIDGPGEVYVERSGRIEATGLVLDRSQIAIIIERLVRPLGLRADRSHPIVDARRPDGTRVSVILDPVAPDGPIIAIRRHRLNAMGLSRFGDSTVQEALVEVVSRRHNVVVYGATGSGKTTLLNALVEAVHPHERVVLIEDTSELAPARTGIVRLEARTGNSEGGGRVSISELVRAALRFRPDRIVVGEVRGAEAADMVWALSTEHRGSMSTIHATTARDAMVRLEVMVSMGLGDAVPLSAAAAQVERAVDVLVGVERGSGGARSVSAIHRCRPGSDLEEWSKC